MVRAGTERTCAIRKQCVMCMVRGPQILTHVHDSSTDHSWVPYHTHYTDIDIYIMQHDLQITVIDSTTDTRRRRHSPIGNQY